jgi:hypothetical protein
MGELRPTPAAERAAEEGRILLAHGQGDLLLVGWLVHEAGVYLWHCAMHASDLLWRSFHQWHHSAE